MFYDIFKKLCDDRGVNPTRASMEIGISRGSTAYWKKRCREGYNTMPDSYTAEKIANYFNVSIDYLFGRTDDPTDPKSAPRDCSAAISEAVCKYKKLDAVDKVKAEAYIDGLLSSDKYRTEA